MLAAGIGRGVYGRWKLQRIVSVLVVVAMLTVTAAVMMSVLAIGGFYALYLFLLSRGIEPLPTLFMTALVAVSFTLCLIVAIRRRLQELKFPVSGTIGDAADAFLDGLLAGKN